MKSEIYLDNASTTKTDERVVKEMEKYFSKEYGNASSMHFKGGAAREIIEKSRKIIAEKINAEPEEIVFTGSGTEANNFAIKGLFWESYPEKNHIITTKIEHDCVLNACKWVEGQGGKITYLDVDPGGFIDLNELKNSIKEKTFLVSVIHANNEIGVIQDLKSIGKICRERKVLFHTDACQSFTKIPINVKKQKIDLMTLNAHKIHGPKGIGALYVSKGIKLTPLLHGGGQEFGKRSSTENVPGIIGFAEAVKISDSEKTKKIEDLRDYLIQEISKIPETKLNGSREKRLCNNINVSFKNIEGEAIVSLLSIKKICVSTGSACSSNSLEPSHVLIAIGLNPIEANSSIRISLSKYNTKQEADYFVKELKGAVEHLRRISPLR